jgi:hypothetical protein
VSSKKGGIVDRQPGAKKTVYLALSVPNRWGQQIFAAFADATDKKERFKIFKPLQREYWPESKIQEGLVILTQTLQRKGYTVEVVPISEYHGVLKRNAAQQAM